MSSPPLTGDMELDSYLYNLQLGIEAVGSAVSTAITPSEINSAYYPEKYLQIRYANSETGKDISTSPVSKKYYGIYNSITTTASENPADYTWYEVTGGFGVDYYLFYTVTFGRNINLFIGSIAPTVNWEVVPTTYIDLDVITTGFVNNESFESEYEPIRIVDTLPDPSTYSGPSIVYVTTTNKMYRYSNGQWTSNVLAADIDGTLAISNFSNDLRPVEIVSVLPTSGNFVGRVIVWTSDGKLYRYTATGWTAAVPTTDLTGTITTEQISNGSISGTKFASGLEPVTVVSSVPSVLVTTVIYNTTDKKLYRWNGTVYISTVPSVDITGQLTDSQLAAIAAAKITGQIVTTQITDNAITTAKISAGSITSNEIAANTITAGDIAVGTITATELAAGSITTSKIAANAVTANEIAANTITAGQIAASAITVSELDANAVTAEKIAANAVTTVKLDALAITADKIAASAITAEKLAADSVTAGAISAGAITADKLAANSVIAGKIAAGSVDATKISVGSLSAISADMGTITAGAINGGTININSKFVVDSAGNVTIVGGNVGITAGSVNINNRFIVAADGATTIQSATTGARTVITDTVIKVYDASNVLRVRIGDLTA